MRAFMRIRYRKRQRDIYMYVCMCVYRERKIVSERKTFTESVMNIQGDSQI